MAAKKPMKPAKKATSAPKPKFGTPAWQKLYGTKKGK